VCEETDSLDVLSLCDEAEFENDDLCELSSNIKKYDSPKFPKHQMYEQDSSGFFEGVELRNKCRTFNGSSRRKEKGRSCPFGNSPLKSNQFSNSLPLTKRHVKVNSCQKDNPQLKSLTIPIEQEPFSDIVDLPSPSSTSLNSNKNFILDLGTKSNSAPILMKNNFIKDDFTCQKVSELFDYGLLNYLF
jgi:hypothetical protein